MKSRSDWESMLVEQVRLHSRLFYRVAYGVLRDQVAAEDVCQQALLKAWQGQDQIRDRAALKAWLLKVVVNESLGLLRRRKTEERHKTGLAKADETGMSASEKLEFREVFDEALAGLPEQTQRVVVLRLVEGMSGNEVKDLLGCGAPEVSRRLHSGLERIRQRMAADYAVD